MTVQEVLSNIQRKLHVPKNRRNTFGNYNYRNADDILEAIKKALPDGATTTLTDEIILIGDRYYVKATATISINGESISVSGYAREADNKKGMDTSQLTGATSSYARKYAMAGLFALDDGVDADSMKVEDAPQKTVQNTNANYSVTDKQLKRMWAIAKANNKNPDQLKNIIKSVTGKDSSKDLNKNEYDKVCEMLGG